MQNIVRLIGASMVNGAVVCQNCGRADTTITYCRTQNGKEVQERECSICGNKIRMEMEER